MYMSSERILSPCGSRSGEIVISSNVSSVAATGEADCAATGSEPTPDCHARAATSPNVRKRTGEVLRRATFVSHICGRWGRAAQPIARGASVQQRVFVVPVGVYETGSYNTFPSGFGCGTTGRQEWA